MCLWWHKEKSSSTWSCTVSSLAVVCPTPWPFPWWALLLSLLNLHKADNSIKSWSVHLHFELAFLWLWRFNGCQVGTGERLTWECLQSPSGAGLPGGVWLQWYLWCYPLASESSGHSTSPLLLDCGGEFPGWYMSLKTKQCLNYGFLWFLVLSNKNFFSDTKID